ncbi:NAD(P)-dependent oxidoreductase [Polymorphobacter multimanifer]|uniref:Uncharacterized protein YbjT (DUF2867 family) n=1 Tax=Polymorphobacter multimanifer TaxID=1070431 RepID=A0A841L284_9SPHN|nr:NmrA family NAD(P)-binding protein [Polymorphobacter multimanifer]MBB6226767.1 uncharacterized protein YbjT (DUF2867 family) [Polymorphobacter multimanifer]GGI71488.1 NAD(P)-dependent oxidoreductase [Polymorphobacter multimanifer]
MILVTGPNGNVGTELVAQLAGQSALAFRVAAHSPEKIAAKYGDAAPHVRFDFNDRSTWGAALDGVTVLFLLFPLPHPRTAKQWMVPFVAAAAAAGVRHIVYLSVPGADTTKAVPHHAVEKAIRASGVPFTILRASFFSQNMCRDITTHAVDVAKHDEIYVPAGRGRTSFIDSRDVAEAAIRIMADPAPHAGRAYLLSGPEVLDYFEVAEIFGQELGRPIRYANPSLIGFWRRVGPRVTWDTLLFMTIVYSLTRFGRNAPMSDDLPRLLGRPARTMRDFVADHKARFTGADAARSVKVATPGISKAIA